METEKEVSLRLYNSFSLQTSKRKKHLSVCEMVTAGHLLLCLLQKFSFLAVFSLTPLQIETQKTTQSSTELGFSVHSIALVN